MDGAVGIGQGGSNKGSFTHK